MSAYYLQVRTLHVACAYVSITLFVVRHVLNLRRIESRNSRALRVMPHVVDTVLLASAIVLMFTIHQYPFVNGWLTVKLALLVVYIVLGNIALKRGRTQSVRRAAFLAAAIIFIFIISVAQTHSPLGVFARFQ